MYINKDVTAGVHKLSPNGTNSTHFTECCDVAICSDESKCPKCKRNIIGYDMNENERAKIRWKSATSHWTK